MRPRHIKGSARQNRGTRSAPYLILAPAQRFQVGKRAAEHAWLHITNLSRGVNVYYVLRNMFSEIFSLREFHNSPNFLLPMCSCNEFAKFSCCQNFPPYGTQFCMENSLLVQLLPTALMCQIFSITVYPKCLCKTWDKILLKFCNKTPHNIQSYCHNLTITDVATLYREQCNLLEIWSFSAAATSVNMSLPTCHSYRLQTISACSKEATLN